MEAGWIHDVTNANGMEIDRCLHQVVDAIYKEIPEKDLRESFCDVYRKNLEGENKLYRIIVGCGNAADHTIRLADGIVKFTKEGRKMDFTLESFAMYDALGINGFPTSIVPTFDKDFAPQSELSEFRPKSPIEVRFFVVNENGKDKLYKLNANQKLEVIELPNF